MFLPYRSKNPPESFPFATIGLIVVNIFVYAVTTNHGLMIKREIAMKYGVSVQNFSPLTSLTSMFLHAEPLHLLGNMLFLYLLGFAVEGRLKTVKFVVLYLLAGLGGDLLQLLFMKGVDPTIPSFGASGAIMGILGAALWMFPFAKVSFFYFGWWGRLLGDGDWWGTVDWPMWGVCALYLGLDIFDAMLLMGSPGGGGVAHFAHIGGALAGFLICMIFRPKRDSAEVSESKAVLDEVKDLTVLTQNELGGLHGVNPKDDLLLLHWMHRCILDGRINAACQATFIEALPRLIREAEPLSLGVCVLHLGSTTTTIRTTWAIELAGRVERANDGALAIKLYEMAFADPKATEAEHEICLFRVAMVSEAVYQNYTRAAACYRMVVDRWPMSPMAEQARARLKVVEARAGVTP